MQQPSAQGIASLYMGNPGALQQTIQKDQQAKPGLPPDLQKMLALQIVTNENDAAKKQTALQQLQQMSGGTPNGKMPTVMETLEAQARQKAQAQAPASAVEAPEGEEPMGIAGSDRVAFQGAEGGIVSFAEGGDGKYETPYDRMNRKNRESEAEAETPLDPQAAKDRAVMANILRAIKGGSEDAGRAIADVATMLPRGAVGAYDTAVVRPMRAAGINAAYLSPKLVPEGVDPASMTPFTDVKRMRDASADQRTQGAAAADNRRLLNQSDAASRSAPATPDVDAGVAKDLADLAKRKAQAASVAQAKPVAKTAPAPAAESDAMKVLNDRLNANPDKRSDAEIAKYKAMVGAPDTAQYDRLVEEMEKRKGELNAPKAGFDGLMEYLGQVAQTGRGKKWYEAGAEGGARVEALNKERKSQQFELTKQQSEVAQKKLDTLRSYAEKTYGISKTAFDQVYKDQHEAAKEIVKDEASARQLAQQNTLEMLKMQNELQKARIMSDGRGAGAANAETKTKLAEYKTLQSQYVKQLEKTYNKADKAALQAKLNGVEAAIAKLAGLDTMSAAPGAPSPGGTTGTWGKASVVNP